MQLLYGWCSVMSPFAAELPLHLRASDGGDGSRNFRFAGAGIAQRPGQGQSAGMIVGDFNADPLHRDGRWPLRQFKAAGFKMLGRPVNPRNRPAG